MKCIVILIANVLLCFTSMANKGDLCSFIQKELDQILLPLLTQQQKKRLQFHFQIDHQLPDGAFSYTINKKNKIFHITFSGTGKTEIAHAGYSFLEHLGFSFEVTGTEVPDEIIFDTLQNRKCTIVPYTRWRGIRQHVNFPMDLSSYPLEEAKEYLLRMMRMRFNQIAIHSYPNLWHEVKTGDSTEWAGDFFYNRPHPIPDLPIIRNNIRFNSKYFSIPTIEPFYDDKVKRSMMSVEWMRELLLFAKQIGFNIHFSIEPRSKGEIDYIIDNCKSAIETYPMIDELEINTEELGGWGASCTDEDVKRILIKRFGQEILKDEFITSKIQKNQTDLDNLLNQIGRNMEAIKRLKESSWFTEKNIPLKMGIYCTIVPYADIAYHLVRKYVPETEVTIMPGHGSMRTADHFSQIHKTQKDLTKTTIFSWIEFDGLMFTQQNPIEGINKLFQQLDTLRKGQQLHAVLFNHWRTTENKIAAKYASSVALYGPMPSKRYYEAYASKKNIADPLAFSNSMRVLEEIDFISTNQLPNYGFCWLGAWLNGGPYGWINRNILENVRSKYDTVYTLLDRINNKTTSKSAKDELRFLQNRVESSIHYINAFKAGCGIQDLIASKADTSLIETKQKALKLFSSAYTDFNRYMETHTREMRDRGCEGTLINLWHGPVYGLKVWRQKLTGIPITDPLVEGKNGEGPPLPIRIENGNR